MENQQSSALSLLPLPNCHLSCCMWTHQNTTIVPVLTMPFSLHLDINGMLRSQNSNQGSTVLHFITSSSSKSLSLTLYMGFQKAMIIPVSTLPFVWCLDANCMLGSSLCNAHHFIDSPPNFDTPLCHWACWKPVIVHFQMLTFAQCSLVPSIGSKYDLTRLDLDLT